MDNYIKILEKFLDMIDWKLLQDYTFKLGTDEKISTLTTKKHLALMIYFHLAQLEGLRELHAATTLNPGIKEILPTVSLGTLSNHNNQRNYQVFLPVMYRLIQQAIASLPEKEIFKRLGPIKILDSTTFSLCLTYYQWAEFRSTKAGVKMHTCYNLNKELPEIIVVSNAKDHDRTKIDDLITERNAVYVFDKGYNDYRKYHQLSKKGIYFVTRAKDNAVYEVEQELALTYSPERLLDSEIEIISDKIIYLGSKYTTKTNSRYRLIEIRSPEDGNLIFLTNEFGLASEEIAWLYKKRWEIELFFKWIKQHLKIKRFIGHSLNAVMIQLITAIITFVMLRILEKTTQYSQGLLRLKRKIKYCLDNVVKASTFEWKQWLNSS